MKYFSIPALALPAMPVWLPKSPDLEGIWQKRLPGFNLRSKIMPAGIGGKPHLLAVAGIGLPPRLVFRFESAPKSLSHKRTSPGVRSPYETPMTSSTPFKIGKYDVVDVIGRGGMGVVYRAKDQQLGRMVAIKMMTASIGEDPELVQRFFREARSTASLQHPNIVTVYELGDYSGNPYLAMEYLEGCSLDAILTARQPLNLVEKLAILVEVCQGLGLLCASAPGDPPGHQAGQHHGSAHRRRETCRLRNRPHHRKESNSSRAGYWQLQLHVPGTDKLQAARCAHRHFFRGDRSLPASFEFLFLLKRQILQRPSSKSYTSHHHRSAEFLPVYPPELESCLLRALAKERDERYSDVDEFAADFETHTRPDPARR